MGDWWRILFRECYTGIALGVILAVVGFFRAKSWGEPNTVAFTVAFTLVGAVTMGSMVGALLPLFFKKGRGRPRRSPPARSSRRSWT